MRRLVDQLFGDERAVGVGRVEERHTELDRASQNPDRLVVVTRRAPDSGARQLHRSVAQAADSRRAPEVEGAGGRGDGRAHVVECGEASRRTAR